MHFGQALPKFTSRELQILELIALGYSAKEVAQQRDVAHRTVETQLDTMRLKLRARNRTHMVAIALRSNLLAGDAMGTSAPPLSDTMPSGIDSGDWVDVAGGPGGEQFETVPVDHGRPLRESTGWFVHMD